MFASRRLFRGFYTPWRRQLYHQLRRPATTQRPFNKAQTRQYRVITYRQVLASWNALRIWIQEPMFYYQIAAIGGMCGLFYVFHLERVPYSGRLRFNIVSEHWENQLGRALQKQQLEEYGDKMLPESSEEHRRVRQIFERLLPHSGLTIEPWDVHIIDDDEISAFVLPGCQIFVYRGLLDFCIRDDELAHVLGHEIAHEITHHTSERLSRQLALLPVAAVSELLSGMNPDLVELAVDIAFRLPRLRAQEEEADHLGLLIVAESGFDPSAAVDLWARWQELDQDPRPAYFRTHPDHHNRLLRLNSWLSEAQNQRLCGFHRDKDFRDAYVLQRSFCGIERKATQVR